MKINPNYILRELAGEWLLVSIEEGEEIKRLLYLNEIGKDIYEHLSKGLEGDALLSALAEDYDADPAVLKEDTEAFLEVLRSQHVLLDE